MVLWDKVFLSVAEEYPDITTDSQLIDAACMNFVRKPEFFDVVVGSNLFGDILTDIGAIITGSMGLAASANLNPTRKYPSLFEPVHGSAPDIAGRGIANPLGAILSVGMMLDYLGEAELSKEVEKGTLAVIKDNTVLTPDLGGTASTEEVGSAVVHKLFN
jgi:tartrate dehydrogenase/decarboxylase/D-malate dehydrogenase